MDAFLAGHRHQLFPPELFAGLVRQGGGHRSVPAEVAATVMVLQALEGLSDREAISALRRDIAWRVACGLRLDDEGFHPHGAGVLAQPPAGSPQPRRIFDAVRQVVEQSRRPARSSPPCTTMSLTWAGCRPRLASGEGRLVAP